MHKACSKPLIQIVIFLFCAILGEYINSQIGNATEVSHQQKGGLGALIGGFIGCILGSLGGRIFATKCIQSKPSLNAPLTIPPQWAEEKNIDPSSQPSATLLHVDTQDSNDFESKQGYVLR